MATFLIQESWWWLDYFYVALAAAALLVCAARPRRRTQGSLMVLAATVAVFPWITLLHGWWGDRYPSIWILFSVIPVDILFPPNPPNVDTVSLPTLKLAVWTVAVTGGLAVSVVLSMWRLLPERFSWRNLPWRDRTWPAFVIVFPLLLVWAVRDTIHYQGYRAIRSGCYDPGTLAILHIEKNAQGVRETEVCLGDNHVEVLQSVRSAVQYKWIRRGLRYEIDPHTVADLQALVAALQTPAPERLHARQAEGWYVRLRPGKRLAFTTENGLQPAPAVMRIVRDSEAAQKPSSSEEFVVDPCLGLCYDPLAVFFARF